MKETYEDRLLTELKQVVTDKPVATRAPASWLEAAADRRRVAAALVAAGAVAVIETTATPAFAIDKHADGSVTVTINNLSEADRLQAELTAAGVPTVAKYVPYGKICKPGWFTPRAATPGPGG